MRFFCGAVAQLGERLTGSQKVVGSNPSSSTSTPASRRGDRMTAATDALRSAMDRPPPSWELERRPPSAALASVVLDLEGYRDRGDGFGPRREPAAPTAVWVINLAGHFVLEDPNGGWASPRLGFVAGPADSWVNVASVGPVETLQVNFDLPGARRFLGMPLSEVCHQNVDAEDVLGGAGRGGSWRNGWRPRWDGRGGSRWWRRSSARGRRPRVHRHRRWRRHGSGCAPAAGRRESRRSRWRWG